MTSAKFNRLPARNVHCEHDTVDYTVSTSIVETILDSIVETILNDPNDNECDEPPPTVEGLPPPVDLSTEVAARLTELVAHANAGRGLSKADQRTVLQLMDLSRRAGAQGTSVPKTAADVDAIMAALLGRFPEQHWVKKEVPVPPVAECGHLPKVYVYVRPLERVLDHLVRTLDIRWGFWPFDTTNGKRVYDHPCSGVLFEMLERTVRAAGADALPCSLWADKAAPFMSGTQLYYALCMVVLSMSREGIRKQWPSSQIAMLPVLKNKDPEYTHLDAATFQIYKASVHAAALQVVLFPYFDKSYRQECMDNQRRARCIAPVFMFFSSDFQEAEALNAMRGLTMSHCTHAPDDNGKLRDYASIQAALDDMAEGNDDVIPVPKQTLCKKYRLQGVKSIMMILHERSWLGELQQNEEALLKYPCLAAPATFTPPDGLHMWDEGILKYAFKVRYQIYHVTGPRI